MLFFFDKMGNIFSDSKTGTRVQINSGVLVTGLADRLSARDNVSDGRLLSKNKIKEVGGRGFGSQEPRNSHYLI